jgi:hypothetical protein
VKSTTPQKFKWDVLPAHRGAFARHPQSVSVRFFALGPVRWGQLYCSWPLRAGHGKVPAVLLTELRSRLGGTGPLDADIDVYSGEFEEMRPRNRRTSSS